MAEGANTLHEAAEVFELSPQQRRLWQLLGGERGLPPRAVVVAEIYGAPEPDRLRRALDAVVARHEVLRTAYRSPAGLTLPLQTVTAGAVRWEAVLDLSSLESPLREAELSAAVAARQRRPVDPEDFPGLSACPVVLGHGAAALILELSVLAADRKSLELMVRDLARAYGDGPEAAAPQVDGPIQYIDFADWQNELLAAEESRPAREYWQQRGPFELPRPGDPPRVAGRGRGVPPTAAAGSGGAGRPGAARGPGSRDGDTAPGGAPGPLAGAGPASGWGRAGDGRRGLRR